MLKIDIHTHIMPKKVPRWAEKFGYGTFIHLDHHKPDKARMMKGETFFREVSCNCWDPSSRIGECNKTDIHVQVLSTIPVLFSYWTKPQDGLEISRYLNDHIAEVVDGDPSRFVGLGTLPMQAPDLAVKELERCVKELGLAGVEIGSHVNEWNLDEERLFPVFQAAERLGAAVFVHPWDMMGKDQMAKYWLPWLVGMPAEMSLAICSMIFGGVLERLPKLRVAFAHGGGAFSGTIGRIEHGFNVRPDLCAVDNAINPRDYLNRIYVDSLVHDPMMLRYLIDLYGSDRIALGSDYPFPLGEAHPGKLIESLSDLDVKTKERLLSGTALEWLDLDPKHLEKIKVHSQTMLGV
ncbi:MAG: hypothetical protein K1060chlam2_01523 [Chlamydiae bacterium]|nr:hypothetical protein [Chlamydiota bacterium]